MIITSLPSSLLAIFKRRHDEESGIALIELLVAITVLVGILTVTAMSLMQGLTIQNQNNQYNQAVQVAQIELDKAKSMTYSSIGYQAGYEPQGVQNIELPNGESIEVSFGDAPTAPSGSNPFLPVQTVTQELTEGGEVSQEYLVITAIRSYDMDTMEGYDEVVNACPTEKKILVKVYWIEPSGKLKTTGLSYSKTADVRDCVPQNVIPLVDTP